jgi:hypothetical protein
VDAKSQLEENPSFGDDFQGWFKSVTGRDPVSESVVVWKCFTCAVCGRRARLAGLFNSSMHHSQQYFMLALDILLPEICFFALTDPPTYCLCSNSTNPCGRARGVAATAGA